MPELPEVETTRRGIAPHIAGKRITRVVVRERRLRWPVPDDIPQMLVGSPLRGVSRRAKYLLFETDRGTLILHLGMSGNLRVLPSDQPPGRHDHLDICFEGGQCLRLNDPRRFGAVLWTSIDPGLHPLLEGLGPEPFDGVFDGGYLHEVARRRRAPVKNFLMDGRVVVGVGNIYANEALFCAGIHPARHAGRVSRARYQRLADAIRDVLGQAIACGGTTLRDFVGGDGRPGYFAQRLRVYGRDGADCPVCGTAIRLMRLGQRSTWFCPRCQR